MRISTLISVAALLSASAAFAAEKPAAAVAKPAATASVAKPAMAMATAKPATAKPAAKAGAAKVAALRTPESLACSKQADAKGLHGKPREAFRGQCMKAAKKA